MALAFALRLADAARASFHLDDFHSLHHARATSLSSFLDVLAQDNHPPLSFLVLRAVRAVAGESELWLRLPNVLYGTAAVALAWRVARRLPGARARVAATALFACSSLHLDLSSDLRMYSLVALCVLGVLDAALDLLAPTASGPGRWAPLRLGAWTAAALLSHYHALHAGAVLALAVGALVATRAVPLARLRAVALPVLAGVLVVLPWYLTGFRAQLAHELAPGGSAVSPRLLAEALVHLVYVRLELAGPLEPAVLALGLAAPPLALFGLVLFARDRSARAPATLLAALALALPVWTALVAWLQPRAGFEWRYLASAIAPFCLLVGAAAAPGPFARLRTALVAALVAGAAALSVGHVLDAGREDYRAAAEHVLEVAVPGDGVLAVEWQPRLFPRGGGFWTYLHLLGEGREEALVRLDHTPDFHLTDPAAAAALPRVHCLLRSIPDDVPLLQTLRGEAADEAKQRFGEAVWVLTFTRADAAR